MQFVDLDRQQQRIRSSIEKNILAVLDHGQYIMGPEIRLLEEKLAGYAGVQHGIACASGTDALLMALMSHGVGPGDAVFAPPFTFIATAEVISLLGAVPVFVDIDPATFDICPERLAQAVTALLEGDPLRHPLPKTASPALRPRGVIAVDLFGLPAAYGQLNALAEKTGLFVIEDAAQSFGAESQGKRACGLAEVGCTSFFPAKPLGGYGDGGMCFTDDPGLAAAMDSIRVHGKGSDKYDNVRIGINGRMDTLQAAVLLSKFAIFPEEIELRQLAAERYARALAGCGLELPVVPPGSKSAWAQYSVLARNERHRLRAQQVLKEAGIPTAVYYPKPLHLQTAFRALGYREGDFPVSEEISRRIFSLPMHPYLEGEDQEKIAAAMREIA